MNLTKLFEMQRELDAKIIKEKGLEEMDRLPYLILALQVELGECANEWRGFKYWSKNQEPRTEVPITCEPCDGDGMVQLAYEPHPTECEDCNGKGFNGYKNKLLEEYVDCLHFILSIGLLLTPKVKMDYEFKDQIKTKDITGQFSSVFSWVSELFSHGEVDFVELFYSFYILGISLGFTWEEVEAAYMAKNAVNHERQNNGY